MKNQANLQSRIISPQSLLLFNSLNKPMKNKMWEG